MKQFAIIFYLIVTVLVGATGDALNNIGQQNWGHNLQIKELVLMFSAVFLFKAFTWKEFLLLAGTYLCFRVAGFDFMYNLVAGHNWAYVGGDNWWDRVMSNWEPGGIMFARCIFLTVGLSLPIKYLR